MTAEPGVGLKEMHLACGALESPKSSYARAAAAHNRHLLGHDEFNNVVSFCFRTPGKYIMNRRFLVHAYVIATNKSHD